VHDAGEADKFVGQCFRTFCDRNGIGERKVVRIAAKKEQIVKLGSLSDDDLRVVLAATRYRIEDGKATLRYGIDSDSAAAVIESLLEQDEALLEEIKQEIARRFNR